MSICRYFLSDVKRMLTGYKIWLAVVGVFLSLLFSRENMGTINGSALLTYVDSTVLSGSLLAYVFCALPYSQVFCEDMERSYLYYSVIRGNLKGYVLSKTVVIFCGAVLTMLLGSCVFIGLLLTRVPMISTTGEIADFLMSGAYSALLKDGHYLIYCFIYAFQLGMLAGVLSLFSAFLSLYITNRVMVLVLPVFVTQILAEFRTNKYGFGILSYRSYHKTFAADLQNILFLIVMSAGISACIAVGIYSKVRKRM